MQKILEGSDFKPPAYVFTPEDFKRMAATLELGALEKKHQAALQVECMRFLALVPAWIQAARPADVRKHLEKVHSDVLRLMETLHALGKADAPDQPARQAASAILHLAAPNNEWGEIDFDFLVFTGGLADLGKAAKDAISDLSKDPSGRPADFPLNELLNRMADLFTEITKVCPKITTNTYAEPEKAYTGKFLDFVEAFLQPLAPHYQKTRHDLGEPIKRVLRARKRS